MAEAVSGNDAEAGSIGTVLARRDSNNDADLSDLPYYERRRLEDERDDYDGPPTYSGYP